MPLIVGSLAHNASTGAGANALHNAAADRAGMDIGSILGSVLGGGGAGGSSLGHIFGSCQDQAAQILGQASGLDAHNAGQLLAMLAPVIMGVLGNMIQKQGMNPGGLGDMLGREAQRIWKRERWPAELGAHQDGDGKLGLDDLLKVGSKFPGSRLSV